ncbi:MAG: HAD family phosphatase [Pseudomonadota bacterium]
MAAAILWDVDGTLVDSEPFHEAALIKALQSQDIEPPPGFHALVVGHSAEEIHAWCQEHLGLGLGLQAWLELKYETYFGTLDQLLARDGAVELFRRLERGGVHQAIVSNSDRLIVEANLRAVGISAPRRVVVSRNDVREGKPHAEPYQRAAWLLGVEPSRCIVVEDSPTGASAGVAAGMRTLFWPQDEVETPGGAERVADMAALTTILEGEIGR